MTTFQLKKTTEKQTKEVQKAMRFDPCMPLSGNYFHQTGKTTWRAVNAETLTQMLQSSNPPEFRTVLGIVGDYNETTPPHYTGPLYFDFDAAEIADAVEYFQVVLLKLQDLGVDLEACRLFASGGKGFHIEIPQAVFMAKVPPHGIQALPLIYKELAYRLAVPTIDLRVYSQGKGRQWRQPNIKRANGNYKVPLTVDEALNITADTYFAIVAAPRPFPPLAPPEFCPGLAMKYSTARDNILKASNGKHKCNPSKTAALLQARCKAVGAALPPSLLALGAGRMKPREGAGFNQIAVQICTTAHALNMSENDLIGWCSGLIARHDGDGSRYGTPHKREAALREMHRYTLDNPCYEFSVGGVRSIFPASASLNDLRGL
jgi:hypothetical protein